MPSAISRGARKILNISKRISMAIRFKGMPFVVFLIVFLSIILLTFSLVEYREGKKDIERLMDSKARLFLQTVFESSRQAILAGNALEEDMSLRLLNNNNLIDLLDRNGLITQSVLSDIAGKNNIFRINLFSAEGYRIMSSHERGRGIGFGMGAGSGRGGGGNPAQAGEKVEISEILSGAADTKIIGFKKGRFGNQDRYAAATRRSGGGAIVSVLNVDEIVDMRERFGFRSLVRGISLAPDVLYAVLQDEEGIIESGENETELSHISGDAFLEESLARRSYQSRILTRENGDVFEAVSPFAVEGFPSGIFRIGFSLGELSTLRERMIKRLAALSGVFLILGIVGINGAMQRNQRRMLAEKLRSLESFTETVLNNTREAVLVFGQDTKIRFSNKSAARLFAVPVEKFTGSPLKEVVPECASELDAFGRSGTIDEKKEFILERQGMRRHVACSLSYIMKGDAVESVITIWNDITEQRRMEERLERNERMTAMGALASGVAHEIRNPLNAIQMIIQRLGREFAPADADKEEYSHLVNDVRGEITRVNKIIEQFLRFARPPEPEKKRIPVKSFASDIMRILENQAAEKDMRLINDGFDEGILSLDPEKMKQVFINLIQNALEAMEPGGQVTISGRSAPGGYRFSVSDTGKGIEPDNIRKIFNLYYSTKRAGTGIGLSLVHQIITQHDGSIEVESTPGKGTAFIITLPEEATR